MEEQKQNQNIYGFYNECQLFFAKLNVIPELAMQLNKNQWKSLIRNRIVEQTRKDILKRSKPYKKINYFEMKEEEFKIKDYFKSMNLEEARMMFSLRMKTTKNIKSHFPSDKKYSAKLWKCSPDCEKIDTIEHIAFDCPKYEHLKHNKDIRNSDLDLVHFFKEVIKLREDEAKTD